MVWPFDGPKKPPAELKLDAQRGPGLVAFPQTSHTKELGDFQWGNPW